MAIEMDQHWLKVLSNDYPENANTNTPLRASEHSLNHRSGTVMKSSSKRCDDDENEMFELLLIISYFSTYVS